MSRASAFAGPLRLFWSLVLMPEEQPGLPLFRRGTILVSGAWLPPGCFDYVKT